jgi:hypothetical protein
MCLGIPGLIVSLDDPEARLATVDVCGVPSPASSTPSTGSRTALVIGCSSMSASR